MTHLMILLDAIQKDNTNLRNEVQKKNDVNLYFESSETSTTELFAKIVNS